MISNKEGKFILQTDGFQETDTIRVLTIGYEEKRFALKDMPEDIMAMNPKITQLDVVFVSGEKPDADEIMRRVKENILKIMMEKAYTNL